LGGDNRRRKKDHLNENATCVLSHRDGQKEGGAHNSLKHKAPFKKQALRAMKKTQPFKRAVHQKERLDKKPSLDPRKQKGKAEWGVVKKRDLLEKMEILNNGPKKKSPWCVSEIETQSTLWPSEDTGQIAEEGEKCLLRGTG